METISAQLALCAGNLLGPGEFPAQKPVTQSFDVFFDLRLNKRLSKQSWGWWFETPSRPLWRHCNDFGIINHMPMINFTVFCEWGVPNIKNNWIVEYEIKKPAFVHEINSHLFYLILSLVIQIVPRWHIMNCFTWPHSIFYRYHLKATNKVSHTFAHKHMESRSLKAA